MKRRMIALMLTTMVFALQTGCGSASKVSAAKPDDKGNFIVNGSFENPEFDPWVVTNVDNVTEELDVYDRDTDAFEGVQSLHFYSGSSDVNFTAEQTITGLESGKYKFTGHIQGDNAGDTDGTACFYVEVGGERTEIPVSLNGYVAWDTQELSGIEVDGQDVKVGVKISLAPGAWGTIDDLTLVKE